MIRVTIDIIPFGKEEERRTLQIVDIANDTTSPTPELGNYDYKATGSINKLGRIEKFPRAIGAVRLALMVLKEAVK